MSNERIVRERPILFSAPMVRAILAEKKNQTRRIIKSQPEIVYRIDDGLIRSDFYDENQRWSFAEADPRFAERGLYGRGRWERLLTNEIFRLWEKGFRGVVCVSGARNKEGLSQHFLVPQQRQGNQECTPIDLLGLSRKAREPLLAGPTPGWEPEQQLPEQPVLGHASGELDGSKGPRSWHGRRETPSIEIDRRGEAAHPLGDIKGTMQSPSRGSRSRDESIGDFESCSFFGGLRLWVRENFYVQRSLGIELTEIQPIHYAVDVDRNEVEDYVRHSCIHMPRWASRITLEVTDVRVQRLQDISEEDAKAEGVEPLSMTQKEIADLQISDVSPFEKELFRLMGPGSFSYKATFQMFWSEIYGKGSWDSNDWVRAISFKRVRQ